MNTNETHENYFLEVSWQAQNQDILNTIYPTYSCNCKPTLVPSIKVRIKVANTDLDWAAFSGHDSKTAPIGKPNMATESSPGTGESGQSQAGYLLNTAAER